MKELVFSTYAKNYDGYKDWYELEHYFLNREKYVNLFRYCLDHADMTVAEFEILGNKVVNECKIEELKPSTLSFNDTVLNVSTR